MQPYNARDKYRFHPLWALHELSNIDKHRFLHVVGSTINQSRWGGIMGNVTITRSMGNGPFKDGDVLIQYTQHPGVPPEFDLDFVFDVGLPEGHPAEGVQLIQALGTLHDYVLVHAQRFEYGLGPSD
jgi:hypothetical protein